MSNPFSVLQGSVTFCYIAFFSSAKDTSYASQCYGERFLILFVNLFHSPFWLVGILHNINCDVFKSLFSFNRQADRCCTISSLRIRSLVVFWIPPVTIRNECKNIDLLIMVNTIFLGIYLHTSVPL